MDLYGDTGFYTDITARNSTNNRVINFPDKTGTVALTTDITSRIAAEYQEGTNPVLYVSKNGRVVELYTFIDSNIADNTVFATLDAEFRPIQYLNWKAGQEYMMANPASHVNNIKTYLSVNSSTGAVTYKNPDGLQVWGLYHCIYISKQ